MFNMIHDIAVHWKAEVAHQLKQCGRWNTYKIMSCFIPVTRLDLDWLAKQTLMRVRVETYPSVTILSKEKCFQLRRTQHYSTVAFNMHKRTFTFEIGKEQRITKLGAQQDNPVTQGGDRSSCTCSVKMKKIWQYLLGALSRRGNMEMEKFSNN